MIVIPAIDVRGGRCVRLLRGDYGAETVYSDDPVEQARDFAEQGASRVHIVDLDAARGEEDPRSRSAVRSCVATLAELGVSVEVGGGVRSARAVEEWLSAGASFVVLGSLALRDPDAALRICEGHPARVLLGLDVNQGIARAQGWTEPAGSAAEHLERWRSWPAAGVVWTSVARDGALAGPDIGGLRECLAAYGGPVIVSGGVSTRRDLEECARAGAAGAIVGRALYEGRLDLREALALSS